MYIESGDQREDRVLARYLSHQQLYLTGSHPGVSGHLNNNLEFLSPHTQHCNSSTMDNMDMTADPVDETAPLSPALFADVLFTLLPSDDMSEDDRIEVSTRIRLL